jgi:hypothetical protein
MNKTKIVRMQVEYTLIRTQCFENVHFANRCWFATSYLELRILFDIMSHSNPKCGLEIKSCIICCVKNGEWA